MFQEPILIDAAIAYNLIFLSKKSGEVEAGVKCVTPMGFSNNVDCFIFTP